MRKVSINYKVLNKKNWNCERTWSKKRCEKTYEQSTQHDGHEGGIFDEPSIASPTLRPCSDSTRRVSKKCR